MKVFSTTQLANRPGDIFREAEERAIVLTRHGKESFVLLPLALYDYLSSKVTEGRDPSVKKKTPQERQ